MGDDCHRHSLKGVAMEESGVGVRSAHGEVEKGRVWP
jgi:hypothetical protein